MANQVTLTFAGDPSGAVQAFDRVGESAEQMGDRVGESGAGFDRAGEAADAAESRAQGFSDTLTGTADVAAGTSEIMKGNLFEGFVLVGGGMADLAGGFAAFLIPAMQSAVAWFRATTVGQYASAAASKVWAAAQWVMNAALWASPITWIVAGIIAVIAVIVLIARRTDWFSRAWRVAWNWIRNAAVGVWNWLRALPGRIGGAFRSIASYITAPFRQAFNAIARLWNSTVGRLSFSIPSWVPGIGGRSFSAPRLPSFHAGGVVPGVAGQVVPILAMAGERVQGPASGVGGGASIVIGSDGSRLGDALVDLIAAAVRNRGGDARQLGIRRL
ncbi:MAG TPA: hypothetical protein VD864_13845 [Nocardioides sp.]|nr:hypothetical protein [Nocardioides sp.]